MKPRRLLSIATLYPNRHTPRFGTFVARSLEALAAQTGWEVTVINPVGLPPLRLGRYRQLAHALADGIEEGVEVHRPSFPIMPKLSGPINPSLIAHTVLPLARRLHAENPFDLVDAQFFYPDGPAAARVAKALNLPLAIKARGADISYWGAKTYARRQMIAAGTEASQLLSVSAALAKDMATIGLPSEKIAIHYTGLDRTRFHPRDRQTCRAEIVEKFGIASDGPLLSTVGALIPRKGQSLVIEALVDLPGVRLALVGVGPDQAALGALVHRLGLADRVHFLGSLGHNSIPLLLAAADAMVLPSESEGLANAWVEALACGCPLVINDAGGAREILQNPSAGLIAERNSQAVAAAVRAVLAASLSPEAVAQNAAQFNWRTHAEKLAEYYDSVLKA